ncbi:MAG: hypothetical protein IT406_02250 [Candidatus Yanofskybacteria bacterium]|nr:hypothetical protein [Candidatus Yanofskybacteria bacterium]
MSGRLKFLLAVLAVGAGLLFWYFASYGPAPSKQAVSASLYQKTTATLQDTDSDGLGDHEETYWGTDFKNPDSDGDGFSDGEEVLSGHNPAKKGPDDFLNERRNLTERTSTLLLGGLVAGDLNPESPQYEASVTALVDQLFDQYSANTAVELDSLTYSDNSTDALIRYGLAMSRILPKLFSETAEGFVKTLGVVGSTPIDALSKLQKEQPETYRTFAASIDTQIVLLETYAADLKKLKVPPSMRTAHQNMLLFVRGYQQQYRAVRDISRDPLQGIIALQVLESLTADTSIEISSDFSNRLARAFQQ